MSESQTDAVAVLSDLSSLLRTALENVEGIDVARASPETRAEYIRFRQFLLDCKEPLALWLERIDNAFRIASEETGARKIPTGTGDVIVDLPEAEWKVQDAALRGALLELERDGLLTRADVDAAISPMTIYRVDNGRLNTLARNRGKAVAEAIEEHRSKVTLGRAPRVHYPRRKA